MIELISQSIFSTCFNYNQLISIQGLSTKPFSTTIDNQFRKKSFDRKVVLSLTFSPLFVIPVLPGLPIDPILRIPSGQIFRVQAKLSTMHDDSANA